MKKVLKLAMDKSGKITKVGYSFDYVNSMRIEPCPRCMTKDPSLIAPEDNNGLWKIRCGDCGHNLEHADLGKLKMSWNKHSGYNQITTVL